VPLKKSIEVGRALNLGAKLPNEFVSYGAAGDMASASDCLHRDPAELADRAVRMSLAME